MAVKVINPEESINEKELRLIALIAIGYSVNMASKYAGYGTRQAAYHILSTPRLHKAVRDMAEGSAKLLAKLDTGNVAGADQAE